MNVESRLQICVLDFGDSTPAPLSEESVAEDSIAVYKWLQNFTDANIYIWGHSLGTPLSSLTISKLLDENIVPTGLILEAPLTNMQEEIPLHPYGKVIKINIFNKYSLT